MARGIYHETAVAKHDMVLVPDHRGKWRIDLVTSTGGNHLDVTGPNKGYASAEEAFQAALDAQRTRGIRGKSHVWIADRDGGLTDYEPMQANGRGSVRPVQMTKEETRAYRAGQMEPLRALRATAQDRANRNGDEVSILTSDGEEIEWCTPLGGAFERNGRRTGILSDGTRVNVYHKPGTLDEYTIVPHSEAWDAQARGDMREMLGTSATGRGFSQWTDGQEGRHLGRSVAWAEVPEELKRHIESRVVGETMVANGRAQLPEGAQEDDYVFDVINRDGDIGLWRVARGNKLMGIETSASMEAIADAAERDAQLRGVQDAVIWDHGEGCQVGHVLRGRWQVDMEPNGRATTADPTAARELSLYIENEYALVGAPNSIGKSIDTNLRKKVAAGTYDPARAPAAWQHLIDEGAKRYTKEFGSDGDMIFNAATRRSVADDFARAWEQENGMTPNARRIPAYMEGYEDFSNEDFYKDLRNKGFTHTQAKVQAKQASHAIGKLDFLPPRAPAGWTLSQEPIWHRRTGKVAFEAHKGSKYIVLDQNGKAISPELSRIRGLIEWHDANGWQSRW